MNIVELIENERRMRKISKGELCKGVGIGTVTYWRWVKSGGKIDLGFGIVLKMLNVLGLGFVVSREFVLVD